MALRSRTKPLSTVGALAALVLGLAIAYQPPASAATPGITIEPVVTVTPSTGLNDGDIVQVEATGLAPDTLQHVGQCIFVDAETLACNQPEIVDVVSDSDGNARAELTVRRTFEATLGDGTPWGTADCDVMTCFVGVGDDNFNGGGAPISFQ